jgi:hypothetical protein
VGAKLFRGQLVPCASAGIAVEVHDAELDGPFLNAVFLNRRSAVRFKP